MLGCVWCYYYGLNSMNNDRQPMTMHGGDLAPKGARQSLRLAIAQLPAKPQNRSPITDHRGEW